MSIVEVRVCGRYKLGAKIGNGTFGSIYLARNVQTNTEVAIKTEEIKQQHAQLLYEGKILQSLQGGIGITNMHWCGQEGDFNFLVMELMGQSLEGLQQICGKRFSLKTTLMIVDQIISNLEYIHFKHYIHRDIKPENFLVGLGKKTRNIFSIDFGLSKKYRDIKTHEHIAFRDKKPLIGTARYASVNAHKGFEQSRRDDLESLGYMLVYFMNGQLPWQNIQAINKEEKYNKIKEKKIHTPIEELFQGFPPEFSVYLKYVRNLKFDEKPDYTYLKKIFKERQILGQIGGMVKGGDLFKKNILRFVREGFEYDYVYDWILIPLSSKNPVLSAKIPITIDVINNEEEFLKQMEENYSYHNLQESLSPREQVENNIVQKQEIMQQEQPIPKKEIKEEKKVTTKKVEKVEKKVEKVDKQTGKKEKDCNIF